MPEFFKNITDSAKFIIMLLVYTGYMTWWASGISHDLENITMHMNAHLAMADHPIQQTLAIASLMASQDKIAKVLEDNTAQHARCTLIMENLIRRIEKVEDLQILQQFNGSS